MNSDRYRMDGRPVRLNACDGDRRRWHRNGSDRQIQLALLPSEVPLVPGLLGALSAIAVAIVLWLPWNCRQVSEDT